jgi:hypothetical protein
VEPVGLLASRDVGLLSCQPYLVLANSASREFLRLGLPMSERSTSLAYVYLAATMTFWAGNAVVGRVFRDDLPPITLALMGMVNGLLGHHDHQSSTNLRELPP